MISKSRGQPRYSNPAIEIALGLGLGLVFGPQLRQKEGLLTSVLNLMGLELAVPDHTTLSRRKRTWQSLDRRQDHGLPGNRPMHVLLLDNLVYGV